VVATMETRPDAIEQLWESYAKAMGISKYDKTYNFHRRTFLSGVSALYLYGIIVDGKDLSEEERIDRLKLIRDEIDRFVNDW
jgi:hypothetical protein